MGFTRKEDGPLLEGQAQFVGDLQFPGMLEAAFLRSPYAHAKVRRLRFEKANALPGVFSIMSPANLLSSVSRLPSTSRASGIHIIADPVFAESEVRYVGEPVAVVLARNRYVAEDAADLIEVDYDPLPAVSSLEEALFSDAPLVHPDLGSNLVGEKIWEVGNVDAVFARAEFVVDEKIEVHRGTSSPIEARGLIAVPMKYSDDQLTLEIWSSTQSPYRIRDSLASMLKRSPEEITVRAPSVGGGFGPKSGFYVEDFVVAWAALKAGVPVRWLEDRREHLLCARQERDQIHKVSVAFNKDGEVLGLKDMFCHDVGAYSTTVISPWTTAYTIPGPYKIKNLRIQMKLAFTHKVPSMTVRGAGRPQAVFVMERVIDKIAAALSMDPIQVRSRNFVSRKDLPWDTGLTSRDGEKIVYDTIDPAEALQKVVVSLNYNEKRAEFEKANKGSPLKRGLGIASYVISTGRGPYEIAKVRLDSAGHAFVYSGACPQGQGHHTLLAQICANRLGIPPENVTVVTGDTSLVTEGFGTFASRSAVNAGNAVALAASMVMEKLNHVAANALQRSASDMQWKQGHLRFMGSGKSFSFGDVVEIAKRHFSGKEKSEPFPFEATAKFESPGHIFTTGAHGAVVEVDSETGTVKVLKYVAAHDAGAVINPTIVEGQIAGGVAHGIGNSLLEKMTCDENGQVLSSTFKDYLLPLSTDVGPIEVILVESPSGKNPLGIKGVGESGAVGAPAAVISAIEHALSEWGATINAFPVTPEVVAHAIVPGKPTC